MPSDGLDGWVLAVVRSWQRHGGEGWAEGNLVGFDSAHVLA